MEDERSIKGGADFAYRVKEGKEPLFRIKNGIKCPYATIDDVEKDGTHIKVVPTITLSNKSSFDSGDIVYSILQKSFYQFTSSQNFLKLGIDGSEFATDYLKAANKPQVNDVELSGSKTSSELGLQSELPNTDGKYVSMKIGDNGSVEYQEAYDPSHYATASDLSQESQRREQADANLLQWLWPLKGKVECLPDSIVGGEGLYIVNQVDSNRQVLCPLSNITKPLYQHSIAFKSTAYAPLRFSLKMDGESGEAFTLDSLAVWLYNNGYASEEDAMGVDGSCPFPANLDGADRIWAVYGVSSASATKEGLVFHLYNATDSTHRTMTAADAGISIKEYVPHKLGYVIDI